MYVAFTSLSVTVTLNIMVVGGANQHGFNTPVNLHGEHHFTLTPPSLTHTPRLK